MYFIIHPSLKHGYTCNTFTDSERHNNFIKYGAYNMCKPKEKAESYNLMDFFGSFATEMPDDAKSLSIALSKFSRWVQSETDKRKPSDS